MSLPVVLDIIGKRIKVKINANAKFCAVIIERGGK